MGAFKNLAVKINNDSKVEVKRALTFDAQKTTKESFLEYAFYRGLFSKKELQQIDTLSFKQFKSVLIDKIKFRYNSLKLEKIDKITKLEDKVLKIKTIKIQVEWKSSKTWGANPTAEIWIGFINQSGNYETQYIKSRSVGGCGYDKLSTAISEALNESDVVKANLYKVANLPKNKKLTNEQIFGYGSGYGVLPSFSSGCGVSTYYSIFKALNLEFKSMASGKSFDVFTVEPVVKK